MLGRPRLGRMGEEELGGFIWLVCHFLPLMLQAGGRVIQGYHTEARRLRWAKVLHHLQRVHRTTRNEHQLKHRWADIVTREQDLLDHLGIEIGGPVGGPAPYTVGEVARFEDPDQSTANMTPVEIRIFQRRAMRYRRILAVESGYRHMARRYRHEKATGVWRAFSQGVPTVSTAAATTSTTTTTQVVQSIPLTSAGPSTSTAPGPLSAPPAPPPTGMAPATRQRQSTGTQTTPAAVIEPADFVRLERTMERVLSKVNRLQQEVAQVNRRVRRIRQTLRRANL